MVLSNGADAASPADVLRMEFVGANLSAAARGVQELPGKSNYLLGNEPARWVTNVPHYARATYQEVYPGVDLVYYGNEQRQLEYDWVVAPGADPAVIRVAYQGAEELRLDAQGNLLVRTANGELTQHAPVLYQEVNGLRQTIAGRYVLHGAQQVGFAVARYDVSQPLVIDPVLSYSTYLGGSGLDEATGVAMDADGNAYVTGRTDSLNFPPGTNPPYQPSFGGGAFDVFVTKLAPDGSTPIYSTYLGGSMADNGIGIAVDASGVAYVTGTTQSLNFPTTPGAFQRTRNGPSNVFVTALEATGSGLVYSTYLGGNGQDRGNSIALDAGGNAYVTGRTTSTTFPRGLTPPLQPNLSGSADAFVAQVNATGSVLLYSTYLGGNSEELGNGIAVDANGYVYVTGTTISSNFPVTAGAYQTMRAGQGDAFLAKLLPLGTPLDYATFLGGSVIDVGVGIALDSFGVAWIAGETASSDDFPTTPNGWQTIYGGGSRDAFVAGIDSLLPGPEGLVYSTYLGGSAEDIANAVGLDMFDTVYVTGRTGSSADFPIVNPVQEGYGGGSTDVFVTALDHTLLPKEQLLYSTFLGGSNDDNAAAIAVGAGGGLYVAGDTSSNNFPTANPALASYGGGQKDAFVAQKTSPKFTIVNVIPNTVAPNDFNAEVNTDWEPSIAASTAADPATRTMAITTFSRINGGTGQNAWGKDQVAPIWVSTNGGRGGTWNMRPRNPRPSPGVTGPGDQTLAYNAGENRFYGAFLGTTPAPDTVIFVRSTSNPDTTDFEDRNAVSIAGTALDQPWIQVARVGAQDRVYVAYPDYTNVGTNPRIARVIISTDGGTTFGNAISIDGGMPVQRNLAPVRIALNGERVYAAFQRPRSPWLETDAPVDAEVVVVRDDNGGIGATPFQALGIAGKAVARDQLVRTPFRLGAPQGQRLGGELSLAVDPNDPQTVYVAYTVAAANEPRIHVRKSTQGGTEETWPTAFPAAREFRNCGLPALAVAANGTLGMLYTCFANNRFLTNFIQVTSQGVEVPPVTLTSWAYADVTPPEGGQYIGDYQRLVAVSDTFYGAFCASNRPDLRNFPQGAYFQRRFRDSQGNIRLNGGELPAVVAGGQANQLVTATGQPPESLSIDPYFFSVQAVRR